MPTFRILHRHSSVVLFEKEFASPDITLHARDAVEDAIKENIDLSFADLSGLDLAYCVMTNGKFSNANFTKTRLTEAVLTHADVSSADFTAALLEYCYVENTDFTNANLAAAFCGGWEGFPKPFIPTEMSIMILDKIRNVVLASESRLNMDSWHSSNTWQQRSFEEEVSCGTAHCLAGWAQVYTKVDALRNISPETAGLLLIPQARNMFYQDESSVLEWLRSREYVLYAEDAKTKTSATGVIPKL